MTNTLLLVGHGKMGSVLLERLRTTDLFSDIHIISPNHTQKNSGNIFWHRDLASLPAAITPAVITFCVKPALLAELLPQYAARFATTPLYISVAAGKTLAFYQQHLGTQAHIVRAMPNTPALIGEAMTALCAADTLSAAARKTASDIMSAIGHTLWLEESQMDAATALSGCGPAYVFLFIDSLIKAGTNAGLSESQAKLLILQTMLGSIALTAISPRTLEELIAQVASPGGVTEAALKTLKKDDALPRLMQNAITAALVRNSEIAN